MKTFKGYLCLLLILFNPVIIQSQSIDTISFKINPRLSFYSIEKHGEMILHVPASMSGRQLSVRLKINDAEAGTWKNLRGNKIIRLPFNIGYGSGKYSVKAEIVSASGSKFIAGTVLTILEYKSNEVKTDCLTGSLIADSRIFFPFGFYCYSPVYPTLPEEEVVMGFNMISPYQKILPGTTDARKSYMDRCAQLGMKVHYNLLSLSSGGSASTRIGNITEEQKMEMLISEVKAFMDHPALLAWYISDEPNGNKIPPEQLETVYNTIKAIDPWHPVSVVFMAPFMASKKYENALDIVMADPYPIPRNPVSQVGDITKQLKSEFYGKKPVWIVPQAFGGGEWWEREPSINEIRSMTYQAIVNGATGIQYFIRQGYNSFPKSTAAWSECGRMALEIAELSPWLLSDEEAPAVTSNSADIQVASAVHDGQTLIVAVNRINTPARLTVSSGGLRGPSIKVLFEGRTIPVNSGTFSDYLPALGSQVYLFDNRKQKETITPYKGNLIRDPGFEIITSPGVPSACYAWTEGDRGATYFLDPREHLEGNHSLRLVTPKKDNSARLRFFPVNVSKGRSYIVSLWAKTNCENNKFEGEKLEVPYFELSLGGFGNTVFRPGSNWQHFVTNVTIPADTIPSARLNVILRMPGKGTAWFDMLQVFEAEDIIRSINPEIWNNSNYLKNFNTEFH